MKKIKPKLLTEFRKAPEYASYLRLNNKASDCLDCFAVRAAENVISKMTWTWCDNCIEHILLLARLFVRRNAEGDCAAAQRLFRRLSATLLPRLRRKDIPARRHKYIARLYATVLYEKGLAFYYGEWDKSSLSIFEKCLEFVKANDIGFRNRRDIERKIASLKFTIDQLPHVRKLVETNQFEGAYIILKQLEDKCGIDYLDHEALTLFAVASFCIGKNQKAKSCINIDFRDSPDCLETRFLYATIHLKDRQRQSLRLLSGILQGRKSGKCMIGAVKTRLIKDACRFLLGLTRLSKDQVIFEDCQKSKHKIGMKQLRLCCIRFVECVKLAHNNISLIKSLTNAAEVKAK